MDTAMKRREFVRGSLFTAGALLVGARASRAAEEFTAYTNVDPSLFQGINRAKDPEHLSGLEQKHVPLIEIPDRIMANESFPVKVTIGQVVHPMIEAHHIQYVELFAGNAPVGRAAFSHSLNGPKVTFDLKLDKPVTLVVREYCNLHGLWEVRRDLAVS